MKRNLEEIQRDGEFKYQTKGKQEDNLDIMSEEIGSKTGRVKGRLGALHGPVQVDQGELKYKPYQGIGVFLLLGGLISLVAASLNLAAGLIGILMLIFGIYLMSLDRFSSYPIYKKSIIRVLLDGEVSERTIENDGESYTDMFADMSVIFAGNTYLYIPSLSRKKYSPEVKKRILERLETLQLEVHGMKFAETPYNPKQVFNLEKKIYSDHEVSEYFKEILKKELSSSAKKRLERDQKSIINDLKDLEEDMNLYVEREGIENNS